MDRRRLGTVITLALVWILGLSVTGALAAETPRRGARLPFVVPAESLSFAGHRETTFGVIHPLVPFYRTLILAHPETPADPLDVTASSPSAKDFPGYVCRPHGVGGKPYADACIASSQSRCVVESSNRHSQSERSTCGIRRRCDQ